MDVDELRALRLRVQGLRAPRAANAPGVVERFVAVQAQEFLPAQWGLATRVPRERRPDAASVGRAVDTGAILRTHVLRPTWHFVVPADARWLMELSGPRVRRQLGSTLRSLGLDGEEGTRGVAVVARALEGGHRTRGELGAALGAAGFAESGPVAIAVLMLAELERVAISGASIGRQRTHAAFDERVPPTPPRPREEALAELAGRYLAARGPATDRDLASWSGFTLADCRRAIADAVEHAGGGLTSVDVGGTPHWFDAGSVEESASGRERHVVDLLQAFDEYIMGYAPPRDYLFPAGRAASTAPEFPLHALVVDGILAGRWAPVVDERRARLTLVPWRAFTAAEERSLAASVAELERFLGVPVTVERDGAAAGGPPPT